MPGTCNEMMTCPVCGGGITNLALHNLIDHPELVKPWQHATQASSDGWTGD